MAPRAGPSPWCWEWSLRNDAGGWEWSLRNDAGGWEWSLRNEL